MVSKIYIENIEITNTLDYRLVFCALTILHSLYTTHFLYFLYKNQQNLCCRICTCAVVGYVDPSIHHMQLYYINALSVTCRVELNIRWVAFVPCTTLPLALSSKVLLGTLYFLAVEVSVPMPSWTFFMAAIISQSFHCLLYRKW